MTKQELIEQTRRSLEAIKEVMPSPIPFELLSEHMNLGERWIKTQYYIDFCTELFDSKSRITFFQHTDQFKCESIGGYSRKAMNEYFVRGQLSYSTCNGYELMEHALENTCPKFSYSVGMGDDKITKIDADAVQLANQKIEMIRDEFGKWLQRLPEDKKQELVDTYNNLYNCYVIRKYNGSHLKLPGIDLSKLGKNETPIELYKSQKDTAWRIICDKGAIVDHEVGSGKAQPLDSQILTPTGWKLMGDIKVGDEVISVDGKATKVIGVFPQGEKDIYRVTMNDGSFTECCEDHLWTVNDTTRKCKGQEWLTLSLKQMLDKEGVIKVPKYGKRCKEGTSVKMKTFYKEMLHGECKRQKWHIPVVQPIEMEEQKVTLHPYLIGALIGDGCLSNGCVGFTKGDVEIIEKLQRLLPENYIMSKVNGDEISYRIIMKDRNGKTNEVHDEIKRLGLNVKSEGKFIPDIYKFNSIENRIQLLQGLMDTDGSAEQKFRNGIPTICSDTYSTCSMQLSNDLTFLIQSLGGVARVHTKIPWFTHKGKRKQGQLSYIFNVSIPSTIKPFTLSRKADLHTPKTKYLPARMISNIEFVGRKQAQCIRVAHESQLYVTDNCIVTHNSLICVIASHEMKRMGIRTKPCILCLKANVQEIVKTYRLAYPQAKVLSPAETDFEKSNRVRLFHEMKNNDWDCIIMTHDQFGKINQDPEIEAEIMNEEVEGLEKDLDTLKTCGYQISRAMKKGLEKRKANLQVALKKIRGKIGSNKDEDINFSDIGIDFLLIDESHKFKNLAYTTRHERVAGLGNQQGNQKALNMLFAIRTLQKRFDSDLQVTFLSGTPISNSLTEMFLLFKYLRPRELARQNISNFDGWAAVFAKKTTDFEFSVTNQIMAKERFRHFIKVPELALFYNEIADFRTKKMINIEEPEMVEELINLTPTDDQQEYIMNLIKFAETGNAEYVDLPPLTESQQVAKMLIATNLAKKMSTDMRLINPILYDDHPNNKVNVCTEMVKKFYDSSMEFKGTQLVFCDIGTPGTSGFELYKELKQKFTYAGIPAEEITFIHDWNERNKHDLFKKMNDGVIRILIGSTDKAGTGLNVQQRVVALHQLDIPWKPAELTQRVGRGVRPGNWGAKLYQDNKVYNFIYATERSLDNYKFTLLKNKQTFISQMKQNELQVRSIDEGSIDEQSGMNFAEYIAVLSGDTTLLEKAKIDKKLAVLEKLKTAHYREISDAKYRLAHKQERILVVEPLLSDLKRDSEQYKARVTRDETGTKENPIEVPACQRTIEEHQQREEEIRKQRALIEENEELQPGERKYQLKELKKQEEEIKDRASLIGEWLIKYHKDYNKDGSEKIGELYGFDLFIEKADNQSQEIESITTKALYGSNNLIHRNKFYAQHPNGGLKYTYNHGVPSFMSARISNRIFLNSLERIENLYDTYYNEHIILIRDIDAISKMEFTAFGKEEELVFLKSESKKLEREISNKINNKQTVGA